MVRKIIPITVIFAVLMTSLCACSYSVNLSSDGANIEFNKGDSSDKDKEVLTDDEDNSDFDKTVSDSYKASDESEGLTSSGKKADESKLRKKIGEKTSKALKFEVSPYIYVENPSWQYYTDPAIENRLDEWNVDYKDMIFYDLQEVSNEKNQIIDIYEWFAEVGISPVSKNSIEDDIYSYSFFVKDDAYNPELTHAFTAYDAVKGDESFTLDFERYVENPDYKLSERPLSDQHVFWVQCIDNVMYVSVGHKTRSADCPYTAYLVAVDLEDSFKVLWKSEPLVSNCDKFEVVGDVIFTGYGYAGEEDYLYEINRFTGEIFAKWPVDSPVNYIVEKGGTLYVRCIDTDYSYELVEESFLGLTKEEAE